MWFRRRRVNPESLTDADLLKAAWKAQPYTVDFCKLLCVARRRKLVEAVEIARQRLPRDDPWDAEPMVALIGAMGDGSDVPLLRDLIPSAWDTYDLATILEAIVSLDPADAAYALEVAAHPPDEFLNDDEFKRDRE